jgi:NAD+ kinase
MHVKIISKKDSSELEKILKQNNIDISSSTDERAIDNPDLIIAYGGDGTVLHSVKEKKPVLPIRANDSFGFIADMNLEQFKTAITSLDKHHIKQLPMIDLVIDGSIKDSAVNDIILVSHIPRSVKFNVYINGQLLLANVIGDGVIVSTPLGSTAYNFSSNGPILTEKNICLTLNNSHSHKNISYILSEKDIIEIEAVSDASVVCDGRIQSELPVPTNKKITIRLSDKKFSLAKIPGFEETFYQKNDRLVGRICK